MKQISFLLGLGVGWGLGAFGGGSLAGAGSDASAPPEEAVTATPPTGDRPGTATSDALVCPPEYYYGIDLSPGSSDARRVKAAHCRETADGGADIRVELAQTAFMSGVFTATITATHPLSADRTFCVVPSWSGHFFNLDDAYGTFHLRIRGTVPQDAPGDDNVQLHAGPHGGATILASETILCTIESNP